MAGMTIGRLARAAGVHVETVRYYQRRGLLALPPRPAGGVRRYSQAGVAQLRFIKRAQDIGFSLAEIKQLLRLQRVPGCRDARALAAAKLSAVEQRMADLERVRGALRRLVGECDAGGTRSCPIIEALSRG
jgi:MerR family transcriptional regulator, mercuric resistance operon regulatory protein